MSNRYSHNPAMGPGTGRRDIAQHRMDSGRLTLGDYASDEHTKRSERRGNALNGAWRKEGDTTANPTAAAPLSGEWRKDGTTENPNVARGLDGGWRGPDTNAVQLAGGGVEPARPAMPRRSGSIFLDGQWRRPDDTGAFTLDGTPKEQPVQSGTLDQRGDWRQTEPGSCPLGADVGAPVGKPRPVHRGASVFLNGAWRSPDDKQEITLADDGGPARKYEAPPPAAEPEATRNPHQHQDRHYEDLRGRDSAPFRLDGATDRTYDEAPPMPAPETTRNPNVGRRSVDYREGNRTAFQFG